MTTLPSASVLVRTWFGDEDAWEALVEEIKTPSEDGFLASVRLVNERDFEGLTAEGLVAKQPGGALASFLADEQTLTSPDHPILAVWVFKADERDNPPFRVVPAELWGVENNINLANMDWVDFTDDLDEDGVFRGFPS